MHHQRGGRAELCAVPGRPVFASFEGRNPRDGWTLVEKMSRLWRWLCVGLLLMTGSIPGSGQEVKSGSGFIFHPDGYILTNNYFVAGSTEQVVILSNGHRVPAKLVTTDPKKDLALLTLPGSNF